MSASYLTAEYRWQKRMRCGGPRKRAWCKHLKRARRRLERHSTFTLFR